MENKKRKGEMNISNNKPIITPDDALEELKNGNERFLSGKPVNINYAEQIENTKYVQNPHSVVLTCLDSRIPPEIIFDQGIGNIFVLRIAGNIADENIIGSMEFGAGIIGSKLILVMGHNYCRAVESAVKNTEYGHLTQLVKRIKPAVPEGVSQEDSAHEDISKRNVRLTIENIMKNSSILFGLVKEGKLKIAGAFYDITSGRVEFLK